MLLNILVKVLDINDANDVIKTGDVTKNVARRSLAPLKRFYRERHISNAYKEDTLVSNYVLCHFWGEICVCYRLASGISADGLKFATRTYIKREFDSKMSKTKFTKLAKWARKKKIWCRSVVLDNFLGAMVLGSFQCRGVLLLLHIVGQGPAVLAAGAGRVGYIFFYFSYIFPFYCPVFGRRLNMTEIL